MINSMITAIVRHNASNEYETDLNINKNRTNNAKIIVNPNCCLVLRNASKIICHN